MSAIFLSYRRDDSSGYAGRLFDNLVERFGRDQVFMDIETLEPGLDFVDGIDRAIESCGAVIAVIGPNWLSAMNNKGRRRLDDPHDFIRLEIATALRRRVRVIPVLVYNASMPSEDDLPEPLRPLCRLQSFEISDNRWEFDVNRLADVLEPVIRGSGSDADAGHSGKSAPGKRRAGIISALALLLVGAGLAGGWWFSQRQATGVDAQDPTVSTDSPTQDKAAQTDARPVTATTSFPTSTPEPLKGTDPETAIVVKPPAVSPSGLERPPDIDAESHPTLPPSAPPPDDPSATQPSAEELVRRERADRIETLLRLAESDLAELRLTRPAGNNAHERFSQVLELDPDNPGAWRGLLEINERYRGLVEEALGRGEFDTAERHLESARAVEPGLSWLQPMESEIQRQRLRAATPTMPTTDRPDRAKDPDAIQEACLRDCELQHQACRKAADPDIEANCLRERFAACDQLHEECMSDARELVIWGRASHESKCAGVHAGCERSARQDCAESSVAAGPQCDRRSEQCAAECRAMR